jgi:tRNA 2-thiouridine synthesizing protein A
LRVRRYGFAMSATDPIEAELDATGLLCPLPVLKARKRLMALDHGSSLVIRADDPAARIDFPHFCNEQGHALLSQTDGPDGVMTFVIRKGG